MILLILSFLAGVLSALAPCTLPLLPVIVGGSLGGESKDKLRPYIIVGSLAASLLLFTLLLKASTLLIDVPPRTWEYLAGGIVVALGLTALFPERWEQLIGRLGWQAGSQRLLGKGTSKKGFVGAVLTGAALGPVFSSCSPTYAFLLATVLPRSFASGIIYLTAYTIGLVVVLLAVAVFGRRFISRFAWASDTHGVFRRSLGVLFIAVGISIAAGWEKQAEIWLVEHNPLDVTVLDQKLIENSKKDTRNSQVDYSDTDLFNVQPQPAPEFVGLGPWINSRPLALSKLKDKVVLVDFWTYSCINCIRTLPYLEKWYETYHDKGFVIVGVHAPEFAFERVKNNVREAVAKHHLTYPVALDNDFGTWRAYSNQYWPAHYLIDKDGQLRNVHFGEGGYATTEKAIQKLLGESAPLTSGKESGHARADMTPETYFGISRANNYKGSPGLHSATGSKGAAFTPSEGLRTNQWTLDGRWRAGQEKITSKQGGATLRIRVKAKDVYVVASLPGGQKKQVRVSAGSAGKHWTGADDPGGKLTVSSSTLYHIASFSGVKQATLTLTVPAGVSLHTFTFGG